MSGVACEIVKERAAATGVGTIGNPVKYRGQDYEKLQAECLDLRTFFEDPEFPAAPSSLGGKKFADEMKDIEWKRPQDFCNVPFFIRDGATRDDIRQGELTDCWLLASVASLTLNEECLKRVVPGDQSYGSTYAGIFNFTFWRHGDWTNVVVDDRLPTRKGRLVFLQSDPTEFWSPLLEKAYAKVCGGYEALKGGYAVEPFVDFTAGVAEYLPTNEAQQVLLEKIRRTFAENAFLTCVSHNRGDKDKNEGIVSLHVYSITGFGEVGYQGGKKQLIRVRNPWGSDEGTGAWSAGSPQWDEVHPEEKAMFHERRDDGEFWMAYSDFLNRFNCVEICNFDLSETCSKEKFQWHLQQFHGRWIKGSNAGGNLKSETFWTNPRYKIKLQDPDKEGKVCTMTIALMQKWQRRNNRTGGDYFSLGCHIFKINSDEKLEKEFFKKNKPVASHTFRRLREVSARFELPPGDYVIVPCTDEAKQEVDYYLRIFSKTPATAQDVGKVLQVDPFELKLNADEESEPEFKEVYENSEYNEDEVKEFLNRWTSAKFKDNKVTEFSMQIISKMMKMVDLDNTKTLETKELKALWIYVKKVTNIFCSADADKTGTIDAYELREALRKADFTADDKIMENIAQQYINKENMTLSYIDFISCMIKLGTLIKMFKVMESGESGSVTMSLAEWLHIGTS